MTCESSFADIPFNVVFIPVKKKNVNIGSFSKEEMHKTFIYQI